MAPTEPRDWTSRKDGASTQDAKVTPAVHHAEHLDGVLDRPEIDDVRKPPKDESTQVAVGHRERSRRLNESLERIVDDIDECVPKTGTLGFVPAKAFQDVGFRLAAKNQDHFEPRIRAFASDQDVKDSAFALASRASSSSLCHSGTGTE